MALKKAHEGAEDLFGRALWDYYHHQFVPPLLLHNNYGTPEEWDLDGFFYGQDDFSELEEFALSLCRGKILDVGPAAGRHSLALQHGGFDVHALDISPFCCRLMELRGVRHVTCGDIFEHAQTGFDTILMMMNGIGLSGTLGGLKKLLHRLKGNLKTGGQLIFDSSDVSYLMPGNLRVSGGYYGELQFRYEYQGVLGDWVEWLYVDQGQLKSVATSVGWTCQVVYEDETGNYLARLVW